MSENLKVQTFNCFGPAYGPRLVFRTKHLGSHLMQRELCDVYFFQEVWKKSHFRILNSVFSDKIDKLQLFQFDELTDKNVKTGLVSYFVGKLNRADYLPFKVNKSNIFDYVRKRVGIEKGVGSLNIDHPKFGNMNILNIHTHPTSSAVRISQIIDLIEYMKSLEDQTIIIGGDFNMEPDSTEFRLFMNLSSVEVAPVKDLYRGASTYSRKNPYAIPGLHKFVDYIFLKDSKLNFSEARVNMKTHNGYHMSDHYGVYAELNDMDVKKELSKVDSSVIKEAIFKMRNLKKIDFSYHISCLESLL